MFFISFICSIQNTYYFLAFATFFVLSAIHLPVIGFNILPSGHSFSFITFEGIKEFSCTISSVFSTLAALATLVGLATLAGFFVLSAIHLPVIGFNILPSGHSFSFITFEGIIWFSGNISSVFSILAGLVVLVVFFVLSVIHLPVTGFNILPSGHSFTFVTLGCAKGFSGTISSVFSTLV